MPVARVTAMSSTLTTFARMPPRRSRVATSLAASDDVEARFVGTNGGNQRLPLTAMSLVRAQVLALALPLAMVNQLEAAEVVEHGHAAVTEDLDTLFAK